MIGKSKIQIIYITLYAESYVYTENMFDTPTDIYMQMRSFMIM